MPKMMREGLAGAFDSDRVEHAGLLFSRGLADWKEDDRKRGEAFADFIHRVTKTPTPEVYRQAYARWQRITEESGRFARWIGRTDGRLFLGLGGAHILETHVTLNRTYGVPLIPGSALKGLARAHARRVLEDKEEVRKVLFGIQTAEPGENDAAGYLLFHDAWWVPDSDPTPLVAEVVTVHHPEYYSRRGGLPATDCDSPNPSHQVAIRGSFLFVVEGVEYWAQLGMRILRDALEKRVSVARPRAVMATSSKIRNGD